ncbi:HAMP domain-containing histidine kinase [Flavobacterium sp. SM15]|uniref:sensor histidine kinase n=1 Tax=Flavobacterium sp. SM15 TaxID=2908005 RepID=UPI001EDB04BE|nr:HAMP domain-containing sensor histidine kinase [Flavobacterium sp. SM15]MCG2610126.1 HAMP domain-containing histidine kinase [Flavobacterium sp. SM15]
MAKSRIFGKLKFPSVYTLFCIVVLSCASLIFLNYYTIKTLSANRAYVNGESHYSKGQKDAARHLITYLYTKDGKQWEQFLQELKVPQGDGIARIALIQNQDEKIIKEGLRAGRIEEKDLDDVIWLFENFKTVSFFAKAVKQWEQGDALTDKLFAIGKEVHEKISTTDLSANEKEEILLLIGKVSDELTIYEKNFSHTLGEGSRKIKNYLLFANVFFILIIISSVTSYYIVMMRKLLLSKKEIEAKNEHLVLANSELDKFVYSASHDLRSPITSVKGLVEIAKEEEDLEQLRSYLDLMNQSLSLQDQFISDIIDYSKNKRNRLVVEQVSLVKIIDEVIAQHSHIKDAKTIAIKKNLQIDEIHGDHLRLKIILNNLVSNAIKYSDRKKSNRFIEISTSCEDDQHTITVKDNGIGIKEEFQEKIFEMFFVTDHNLGSGLGLYIAKEAVNNLNGLIRVESCVNVGTKFIVSIPKCHET